MAPLPPLLLSMPLKSHILCPHCGKALHRKPAGRCPHCGGVVAAHVAQAQKKEERIEKGVALAGTFLVFTLFLLTGGLGLIEGVVGYTVAGLGVWLFAKRTFFSRETRRESKPNHP